MSVLSACQDAAREMGLVAPSSIYTSTDKFAIELGALANESVQYIGKQHDWRLFLALATLVGDGTTTNFSLPSDYDRMQMKQQVFRTSTARPMEGVIDLNEWLERRLLNISSPIGEWIIGVGLMQIYPAMASTDSAQFYYCSNKVVADSGGVAKAAFTADTDTFRLSSRLLKLALKWRWRAMKKLDSADEQEDYEIAQAQEIARDKGSRIITVGQVRMPDGVNTAYPGQINA